jgi:cell division protein FtsW (lipid II flippase)
MIDTTPPAILIRDLETTVEASVTFRERLLLAMAGLFILVAHTSLILAKGSSVADYWRVVVWIVCAAAGHLALQRRLPRRDPFIFPIVMLLSGWGLALIDRLAPPFATRQTVWLVVAVAAMIAVVTAPGHLRWLSRYRYLWLVGGLLLLALTIVVGRNPSGGGPRLWLGIPDVYFQPSELLKVLLVAFLASYLADNRTLLDANPNIGSGRASAVRFLAPLLLMWGISVIVLIWQEDLGTATLFFVVFLSMLYLASGQIIYVVGGVALLLAAGALAYGLFDVVKLRIDTWVYPWNEYDTRAFQIVQSLLAFSAGGVFGQGIAQGSPTYVPVVHSDFVFAAIGEEWGLLGTLTVVGCMALLVLRGLRLAAQTEYRPFRSFLAAGLSITFATQSLLIMGGVLKLVPLTGVTLPFLSYGGSSLLISFIMVGLLTVLSGES